MTTSHEAHPVEQHLGGDLPQPAPGPFRVISGTLALVTVVLGLVMLVGSAASLPW